MVEQIPPIMRYHLCRPVAPSFGLADWAPETGSQPRQNKSKACAYSAKTGFTLRMQRKQLMACQPPAFRFIKFATASNWKNGQPQTPNPQVLTILPDTRLEHHCLPCSHRRSWSPSGLKYLLGTSRECGDCRDCNPLFPTNHR